MEENYRDKVSSGYFTGILKSVAISLTVTFIILIITALFLCFTDFPEIYTFPSAIAATVLGVFAGSSLAAKKNPCNSLISSLLTAFIYAVVSFIIGSILERRISFTLNTGLFVVISLLTGAIASILANRTKKNKNYSNSSPGLFDRIKKKGSSSRYRFN
ncbi:MAG: TIGR04086 family membrane protein, partial [Clostridiaceae bacterium]|nr:TIGR04086 family membrane protein [Clostridiaceae bacterium]